MKDIRKRQAVKPDYIEALGMAAWSFASCEWQVAWCCEKIRPGSLTKIVEEEMTAGKIAKYFIDLSRNMRPSMGRKELKAARTFVQLVQERNAILHGKPCTGPNGESRLSNTKVLEIPDLENSADSFAAYSNELNRLSYGFLSTLYSTMNEATPKSNVRPQIQALLPSRQSG
jgi:hypothetical protein